MPNQHSSPLAFAAIQAALNAGQLLRRGFGTDFEVSSKENPLDLVTSFDKEAEKLIIGFLRKQFPDHAFLAEESGASDNGEASVLWIIDPIDGTMNFAHHIPLFAVSIAAMVNNVVEVGVIYQPITNELFVAHRGRGAYLNGSKISVSNETNIEVAVGATGFPYGPTRSKAISKLSHILDVGNPVRVIGSSTLILAYTAAGRFDLCWGTNLKPWDAAAGKLLIEEAGGLVTHFDGTAHDMFKNSEIFAANPILHQTFLKYLK